MAVRGGARWALIVTGVLLALIAIAAYVAPPIVARHLLRHYLAAEGVSAHIGHIHTDLLSGTITLDDVHGQGPDDRGFDIGHLTVRLAYAPLFDHHVELSSMDIAKATLDIGRDAHQQFIVAGVPIASQSGGGQSDWGFGLGALHAADVALHYREPARDDQPAVDQTVDVATLSLGSIATWQPEQSTPAHTELQVADGQLKLDGQASPLGAAQHAHFAVHASNFSMAALTPLARLGYITALGGTFDADQELDVTYGAHGALSLELKGQSRWRNAHLAATDGTDIKGKQLAWQGDEKADLWRGHSKPGHITANGTLKLAGITARRADQLDFTQDSANWHGTARAELDDTDTRVRTHGKLDARKTRLTSGDWLKLASDAEHLTGDLDLSLTPDETRIDTSGGFSASAMSLIVPDTLKLDGASVEWDGKTTTRLAGNGTDVQTDGHLTSRQLVFDVPDTSHVTAGHVDWHGNMNMHSAALFARRAQGRLEARDVDLSVPDEPVRITAKEFGYQGRYAEQPDASGRALRLTLAGDAHGNKMRVMNPAIDAPWISMLEAGATGIDINGLDDIGLNALKVSGVRILGDTDTRSAVVQAVTLNANTFALRDLAHYSVRDLELGGANIHTRRDAHGMGVISQFIDSVSGDDHAGASATGHAGAAARDSSAATDGSDAASTFAVDVLHISGPALAFVDTTMTPTVAVNGANVDFTLKGLDTAKPDQDANYNLSMDVGAYGHLDSIGQIAPFAPGGIRMNIKAWLRSLALPPMSGYLNAAMGRKIANGVADGTLKLSATKGQLDGTLDTTITNFRLADSNTKKTDIAYGISMNTALKLIRGHDDIIHFNTKILGDATNPYFSLKNLVREAVLAGLRTALLSNYSPIGLLNNAKNSLLNLFRSVEDRPAIFAAGMHYIRPDDRRYLALIAQALVRHPDWTLHVTGHTAPPDIKALHLERAAPSVRHLTLEILARQRADAVQDYLTARNANPARIVAGSPTVLDADKAQPSASFSLDKH